MLRSWRTAAPDGMGNGASPESSAEFEWVFREISALSRILHELPHTAVHRRLDLQEQIADLKQRARNATESLPSTQASLQRDISHLERAIAAIDSQKINVAANSGGSPGGDFGFTKDAMDINNAMDRNAGRDQLVAKLRDARAKLAAGKTPS